MSRCFSDAVTLLSILANGNALTTLTVTAADVVRNQSVPQQQSQSSTTFGHYVMCNALLLSHGVPASVLGSCIASSFPDVFRHRLQAALAGPAHKDLLRKSQFPSEEPAMMPSEEVSSPMLPSQEVSSPAMLHLLPLNTQPYTVSSQPAYPALRGPQAIPSHTLDSTHAIPDY